ncbi:glycosyltransferase family 2 protein [Mucilaginibacter flavus]|uniref:glycosyltransferase family 2 protein n=1 Tax=Mucilaginibacter flavus TaxID=931504 RepID=UPI0025B343BE|nr:glycosyltransferase family A protein [Mucilaginibacter flavus]MDN3584405.1 glycosyltransferase family A protein [Mucilaginibacter flavus]
MRNPLVTVIMPVYNCEKHIADAIESILSQTYANLELIIIDDCSTDHTRQLIGKYTDDRIVFIKKEKNTGLVSSLNLGIKISKGGFLARMDGDDISHQTRLSKQVRLLTSNPDIVLCGTWYQLSGSNEIIKNPVEHEDIKISLLDHCVLGHPSVMFRKDFLTANELTYDDSFYPAEDYELWTRISAIGKIANIPEVLLWYRTHENQVSNKEQSIQLTKSYQCKVRMMCYPLSSPSQSDISRSAFIVENGGVSNLSELQELVSWLDRLSDANKQSSFYDEQKFQKYINNKKRQIIRKFYLHSTSYSPSVLFSFSCGSYFTANELVKFTLKCIFFWK